MILLIFRVFALLFLFGGIGFFVSNLDHFRDLAPEVSELNEEIDQIRVSLETEINATSDQLSLLLKSRSQFSQTKEDLSDKSVSTKEEASFLEPKFKQLGQKLSELQNQVDTGNEKLEILTRSLSQEKTKQDPYFSRISELEKIIEGVRIEESQINESLLLIEGNFTNLSKLREMAKNNFLSVKKSLIEQLVPPNTLFYDEKLEVEVENVPPSQAGFFSKSGTLKGIRDNFVFLASSGEFFEDTIFLLRCKFAEKSLSYFEIEKISDNKNEIKIMKGEKLFLIRTGDFPIDESLQSQVKTD